MGRRDIELNIPPNPLLNPIRIVLPDQVVNDKNWPAGHPTRLEGPKPGRGWRLQAHVEADE